MKSRAPLALASLAVVVLAGLRGESCSVAPQGAEPEYATPVAAWEALVAGNARWVAGKPTRPNATPKRCAETAAKGQKPFATVLACSDSRVPVEMLFDRGVGDVFTIRVAGNVADTDEIGSIEYGVDHLGTPVLVVLGHTGCGAVTAVCQHAELHGSIPELVAEIGPVVAAERERLVGEIEPARFVERCVEANVFAAIASVLERSPAVRARVKAGTTRVIGAVYDLATGVVRQLGEHPEQQALLERPTKVPPHASPARGH
ncbi:MAG: carbonic anhydrase [Planctomycetes bacterium]|nr:carbonic anhydrase [Planctomycetota bacterium]